MKSERLRSAKRESRVPAASEVSGVGAVTPSQLDASQASVDHSRRSGRVVRKREAPESRGRRVDEEEQKEGGDEGEGPESREEEDGTQNGGGEEDGLGRGAGVSGRGSSRASGPQGTKRERGEGEARRAGIQAKKEAKRESNGRRRGRALDDEEDEDRAGEDGRQLEFADAEPRGDADGGEPEHVPDGQDAGEGGAGSEPVLFRGPARGADDFCKGNILTIRVQNFMTFGSITLKPSPRLNLIIGPNGTGKSSIVCAIGIALAGEPRMLGRAADVRDFVQRGKERGMVHIELRGARVGERIAVERRIDVHNKSEWVLNGTPAKREDVRKVMKDLNIQVENLTQFLPQDRVCEFAGLSRERLLEETLKAVGDPQLSDEHRYLCDARGRIKQQEDACRASTETLGRLRKENEEIERDVRRLEQRQKLLDEAALMRKKAPWIECSQLEDSCEELQTMVARLTEGRDQLHMREVRARALPDALKRIKDAAEVNLKEIRQRKGKLVQRRERAEQEVEEIGEKVRSLQSRANAARASDRRREQKLQQAREDVQSVEKQLSELPELEHPKEKLEPLGVQGRAIRQQSVEKEMGVKELERQFAINNEALHQKSGRLRFVQNARNRRIRRAGDERLEEACRLLDANRASLNAPVYGPLLAEITVTDPTHSSCLEQHVPFWIWKCFVTTNSADRDYLVPRLRQYNVAVVNEEGSEEHFRAVDGFAVSDKLRSLGVTHRMDEVFTAPPVVRHTLIKQGNLNHAFIGSDAAEQHVDAIHREGIMDLSTPQSVYYYRRSRYHSGVSMSLNPVRPSRLFGRDEGGLREEEQLQRDIEELTQESRRLGECIAGAKRELAELERQGEELERQRDDIKGAYTRERRARDDLHRKLAFCKSEVASLEGQESADAEAARLVAQVPQLQEQQFAAVQRVHKALLGECRASLEMADLALATKEVGALIAARSGRHRALREELLSVQQQLHQQEARLGRAQEQAQAARQAALEVVNPDEDEAVRELFDELPDNLEELEEAVREKQREADRLLCNNPHLAQQYQQRKADIERKSAALEEQSAELSRLQAQLDAVQARWLPKLRSLVGRINDTFAQNFREMAVAGEVVLDEHGDDFKAYGIRIRVQFRDTAEMQDLSAHHQSGGERSVSTILYLVALQELTYCPFRVVDEINQGMDATNERKMFQQLVRATCKDNTPQCFLVTPKLLPGLDYGDRCTVHTVMNGPHNRPITQRVPGFRGGESFSQSVIQASQPMSA